MVIDDSNKARSWYMSDMLKSDRGTRTKIVNIWTIRIIWGQVDCGPDEIICSSSSILFFQFSRKVFVSKYVQGAWNNDVEVTHHLSQTTGQAGETLTKNQHLLSHPGNNNCTLSNFLWQILMTIWIKNTL